MDIAKEQFRNIDEYIDSFPKEVGGLLNILRQTIKEEAPEAEETIKYKMPTFTLNGNLVHFAAWKHHIGFYPPFPEIAAFKKELSSYETGAKGSIQFPIDKPLPLLLIRKMVKFRVQANLEKKAGNKRHL